MPEEPVEASFERRIVSVLFADLVGFTSLSERLDPEDVAAVQDAYFATVRETVARHGGQLEKFIGDAAMAVFGIPRARDDDAERAIRAGLALVGAVELLGVRLGLDSPTDAETDAGLRLRVGINTGEVVSAESGPDRGRVTGDTVNLAARLQTAAEPGSVLVGELTSLSAADAVVLEPVGERTLKGKAEPVPSWRVVGLRPERSREQALGALRAPLLGREAEVAALEATLATVRAEEGAALQLIVAPPGVGKSRLLAEFGSRAEAGGAQLLRARVRADEIGPLEPVEQLLRAALGGSSATPAAARAELERALAATDTGSARAQVVIDEVVAASWPTSGPADAGTASLVVERDARFGAWLEALDALAGATPSVWLIEDVHWAGGDLRAFLGMAASWPSNAGRLVLATARPSVLEQGLASTSVLELPPLPTLDSAELVTALVGDALPAELTAAVAERSDGNPLFIEELLRSWISSGTLVALPEGGWQLAVAPGDVPLPATVQAIYSAQLDDLPPAARLVARRASVAGRRFAVRALEPLEVPEPAEGVGELRRRAFLRGPEPDAVGDEVYTYRHALLRDAGYASLSRAERMRWHLALARWLEQTAGTDVARVAEPIASHYEAALAAMPQVGAKEAAKDQVAGMARVWLARAADSALGVAAHEAAISLLGRAAELAEPGSLEAARLRLRRGELLAATGDMALGIGEIEAALDIGQDALAAGSAATRDAARDVYGNAVAALGDAMIEQIRFIEARELATEALERIGEPEDALVGRLLALRAWAGVAQGDREGTLAEAERAMTLVRGAGARIEVEVRSRLASVRSENLVSGPEDWEELEELARLHGDWAVLTRAMTMRVGNLEDAMSPREVLAVLDEAMEIASAHGLSERVTWSHYMRTVQLLRLGDWDEAVGSGLEGIALGERNAYFRPVFRTWIALAPIITARRDASLMERYAAWFDRNRSAFPDPLSAYGQVLMAAMDYRLASLDMPTLVGRAVGPEVLAKESYLDPDWLAAVESVFAGWIQDGHLETAAIARPMVEETMLLPGGTPPGHLAHAHIQLAAAWVARGQGRTEEAMAHARASVERARSAEAPWWLARAIRALPDGEASAEDLAEAASIERQLGITESATAPPR